jgi:hypothetical protein
MSSPPGQNSGQGPSQANSAEIPAGYTWGDYVAALVDAEGTLTAVAQKLLRRGADTDDIGSVERALRRLRERGQRDGGVWGQRLLRAFGVPRTVEARVRWMGLYHSPFTDLPVGLCLDLLRVWDRPPVSESKARVYLLLGFAICALRQRQFDEARAQLDAARSALAGALDGAALVEHALELAYLESREAPELVPALLDEAERALASAALDESDRACFEARLVDQRAFRENHERTREGYERALARYEALSPANVHPFASYRREAGLAYGHLALGNSVQALAHAEAAVRHAGDGGFVRLRVMGLILEARILGSEAGVVLDRAHAIALRLGDEELLVRVARARAAPLKP